ncbi:MAG: hypothetical protein IJR48_07755, partial [Oscillibacter sp.]|nr:hypothetical protein [Oscillibacter sp.]
GERQRPDCIMLLAVLHHMAISNNLPFGHIARWLSELSEHLIIEFVPKDDSQVQLLLATRDDIFPDYHAEAFESAFSEYFTLVRKAPVEGSQRMMYLWKRAPL